MKRKRPPRPAWEKWEDEMLIALKERGWSYEQMPAVLRRRTPNGCRIHAQVLGIADSYRAWTTKELAWLRVRLKQGATYAEIAAEMGRTRDSVRSAVRTAIRGERRYDDA